MEDQFVTRVEEKKSKWRKVKCVRLGTNGKTTSFPGSLLKTATSEMKTRIFHRVRAITNLYFQSAGSRKKYNFKHLLRRKEFNKTALRHV